MSAPHVLRKRAQRAEAHQSYVKVAPYEMYELLARLAALEKVEQDARRLTMNKFGCLSPIDFYELRKSLAAVSSAGGTPT